MTVPIPTPILRFIHVDNLRAILERRAIWAPNFEPKDGNDYKRIHNADIQDKRRVRPIPCGPGGVIHDYVPFYLGPRSPMLLQLHTGRVRGYEEGQEPLVYLVSTAQAVAESHTPFVFSDGHGIATFTDWFSDLADLDKVDWDAVYARIWKDKNDDMDRQRRKQAEFLVHKSCPWALIHEIAVINERMKTEVERVLAGFSEGLRRLVTVKPDWYY
jgi:hypothetical protein